MCAALSYPNPSISQEILAALAAPAADAAAVAAQCRYDAAAAKNDAAAKYDAVAAEYKANVDEKRETKLNELKDEAFANLQSANEYLALTFRNIPDAFISSSCKREAEEDPEREAKRSSESTFLAKELLAMMHTLRPGGGVEVYTLEVKLPQAAADDDDDEEATADTVTFKYLELPEGIIFRTTKGTFGSRVIPSYSTTGGSVPV